MSSIHGRNTHNCVHVDSMIGCSSATLWRRPTAMMITTLPTCKIHIFFQFIVFGNNNMWRYNAYEGTSLTWKSGCLHIYFFLLVTLIYVPRRERNCGKRVFLQEAVNSGINMMFLCFLFFFWIIIIISWCCSTWVWRFKRNWKWVKHRTFHLNAAVLNVLLPGDPQEFLFYIFINARIYTWTQGWEKKNCKCA